MSEKYINTVVSREVEKSKFEEFVQVLKASKEIMNKHEGFIDLNIIEHKMEKHYEVHIIYKFANMDDYLEWNKSNDKKNVVNSLNKCSDTYKIETITSFESWFYIKSKNPVSPPPKYKVFLLVWLSAFVIMTTVSIILSDFLTSLNQYVKVLFLTGIMVSSMTYFVMPFLTRIFYNWLHKPVKD